MNPNEGESPSRPESILYFRKTIAACRPGYRYIPNGHATSTYRNNHYPSYHDALDCQPSKYPTMTYRRKECLTGLEFPHPWIDMLSYRPFCLGVLERMVESAVACWFNLVCSSGRGKKAGGAVGDSGADVPHSVDSGLCGVHASQPGLRGGSTLPAKTASSPRRGAYCWLCCYSPPGSDISGGRKSYLQATNPEANPTNTATSATRSCSRPCTSSRSWRASTTASWSRSARQVVKC